MDECPGSPGASFLIIFFVCVVDDIMEPQGQFERAARAIQIAHFIQPAKALLDVFKSVVVPFRHRIAAHNLLKFTGCSRCIDVEKTMTQGVPAISEGFAVSIHNLNVTNAPKSSSRRLLIRRGAVDGRNRNV